MGSTSTFFFCKTLKKSPAFVPVANIAHNSVPKMKLYRASLSYISHGRHSRNVCLRGNGTMRTGFASVACAAKDSGSPEEHKALDTVLKLYEAIKNKNVCEISDIIAEECSCVSNFVWGFQPFHGKKQVLAFFSSLIQNLGNNIEFVVQQTSDDGMVVAVSWKLEWNKVPLPLGKGFSFYMYHVYQGKVMIKNVEIFMEPLLHIKPLRLKVITFVMTVMEKINLQARFRNKGDHIDSVSAKLQASCLQWDLKIFVEDQQISQPVPAYT
ncbi:hypothetical protein Sango_1361800 [Sesamum angolense]|uniref:Nuclear transport factor 2 domain-containing protein n=1 Tax=Sesamum angolense TaxID=2727404 RepID=A0AAE1WT95_9LAMI|nr:hypothetical protein Sango_1361800 [Sesamum angolense]